MEFYKRDVAYLVAILLLFALLFRGCDNAKQYKSMYMSALDSIEVAYDELGRQTAMTSALEVGNRKILSKLQSQDSTVRWLQNTVKKYKGKLNMATVVASKTTSSGTSLEPKITRLDTVLVDSTVYIYPQYEVVWENKWESGSILANRDSITRHVSILNGLELTVGKPRNRLFKPIEYTVQVKNLNPNTTVHELKAVTFKPKVKRFVVSFQLGAGINTATGKPALYIGLGLGVVLFQI